MRSKTNNRTGAPSASPLSSSSRSSTFRCIEGIETGAKKNNMRTIKYFSSYVTLFINTCAFLNNAWFALSAECADNNDNCSFWASQGECQSNPGFMHQNCPVSCDTCVDMSEDDLLLIEGVIKYGKNQLVQVILCFIECSPMSFISVSFAYCRRYLG